jgi:hypothetical protein
VTKEACADETVGNVVERVCRNVTAIECGIKPTDVSKSFPETEVCLSTQTTFRR